MSQTNLFGTADLACALVLIDGASDLEFDYAIPENLRAIVVPGTRVRVPLRGRGSMVGTVLQIRESEIDPAKLKPIEGIVEGAPVLDPALLRLASWVAEYYHCPLESVVRSMLPSALRGGGGGDGFRHAKTVALTNPPTPEELDVLKRRAPKQHAVVELLTREAKPVALSAIETEIPGASASVRALEKKGIITPGSTTVERDPYAEEKFVAHAALEMTDEQNRCLAMVVAAVDDPAISRPILLHGVTGSGKTEVYLQAIKHAVSLGKSAIVLVPEISLTPQTVERFKSRFSEIQDQVAVLHSHLGEGERHDEWRKIQRHKVSIVIGARSAIFAPARNLGLVIVDEEHETSYKQDNPPRYNGRDLAVVRGHLEGAAVLLGSATPSLESYHNTQTGKYALCELPQRVDGCTLPLIRIVDMRQELRRGGAKASHAIISPRLGHAIAGRLEQGEQCILFLNRRGFASSLTCPDCGWTAECQNCSISLTYHREEGHLICHICGFRKIAPKRCGEPTCRAPAVKFAGFGTEKAEAVVRKLFPTARVARVDADSMARKNQLRDTLAQFRSRKLDILVGTQMIAKGLHFPGVTLVGILNADIGLKMPDFRAGERTFQLLTQVAGRAGRGDMEGEVFVQTFTPHSPSIQFARHHDFGGFFDQELDMRRSFGYPPFTHLALVMARSEHEVRAEFSLQNLHRRLKKDLPGGIVLGEPVPSSLIRAVGQYRFQLILRAANIRRLTAYLKSVLAGLTFPEDVIVTWDIDPQHLG